MAGWVLIPSLISLRDEFNALAPSRDKASDGAVGDTAHAQESSDHNPDETGRTPYEDADDVNEVHAIDVDNDLNLPGWTMDRCVETIVSRHRDGADDRLQNVIYDRRIWSRSWGWTARTYTGASAHTEHAHFSARYGSGTGTGNPENDTRPWGLLEEDTLTISPDDLKAIARAVANQKLGSTTVTVGAALQSMTNAVAVLAADAGKDPVDEQALAQALLPLLGGGQLEAIIRNGMTVEERHALAARLAV